MAQAASVEKGTSPLIHLLALAGLVASAALLRLPHGVPDGFAAALLAVHLLKLAAAGLKELLLGVGNGKDFLLINVWAAAPLLQEMLAGAERPPQHLLAALLPVLAVHGSGGVGGGTGESHQGHQESCRECYLDRH